MHEVSRHFCLCVQVCGGAMWTHQCQDSGAGQPWTVLLPSTIFPSLTGWQVNHFVPSCFRSHFLSLSCVPVFSPGSSPSLSLCLSPSLSVSLSLSFSLSLIYVCFHSFTVLFPFCLSLCLCASVSVSVSVTFSPIHLSLSLCLPLCVVVSLAAVLSLLYPIRCLVAFSPLSHSNSFIAPPPPPPLPLFVCLSPSVLLLSLSCLSFSLPLSVCLCPQQILQSPFRARSYLWWLNLHRFPTKEWLMGGTFEMTADKVPQPFSLIINSPYIKFVRMEMLDHYGNEHFCPVTLFRWVVVQVQWCSGVASVWLCLVDRGA